jgi:hypothetical protein
LIPYFGSSNRNFIKKASGRICPPGGLSRRNFKSDFIRIKLEKRKQYFRPAASGQPRKCRWKIFCPAASGLPSCRNKILSCWKNHGLEGAVIESDVTGGYLA